MANQNGTTPQNVDLMELLDQYKNGAIPPLTTEIVAIHTFKPLTRADLRNRPPKQFIIEGLLGKGDIAMLYGAPGSGKTFVVIDLIMAMVTGHAFMDRYTVPQPLNVVYATNEGLGGLNQRVTASENKHMARMDGVLDATNERLTTYEDMPQLYDVNGVFSMETFTRELLATGSRVDVLVLDTLSNAILGAEENSSNHMSQVMAGFRRACATLGCTGVLVHHTNKGGGYRGSSVLHGSMDLALEVTKDEYQQRELKVFKIKDRVKASPNEGEGFPFYLQGDDVTESCYPIWDNDTERAGRKATQQGGGDIDEVLDGEMTQGEAVNEMMRKWNLSRRNAVDSLNRAVNEGKAKVTKGGKTGKAKMYQLAINETNQLVQ